MNRNHQNSNRRTIRRAFTLLEVIVAVTIVALLATLVVPRLFENIGKSKTKVALNQAATLAQQVRIYMSDTGMSRLPDDFDLNQLVGEYIGKAADLNDPWGRQFQIIVPGQVNPNDFDVVSYGADGEMGGEGEDTDVVKP
jgi:general secretion pathway protein G